MNKILVVDDEIEVVDFLNSFLRRKGVRVFTATDARSALDLFTRQKPDLVLLDVSMPGEDGLSVLKKMKEAERDTNVIMITARDDRSSITKARDLGAGSYLVKPIELENLDCVVSRYIGS